MSGYSADRGVEKILKRADPSTIQDKFLVGYQGWYTCAGDGEPPTPGDNGWSRWFDSPIPDGGHPNTDLWPDVSSYSPSELFPAPGLKTQSGDQVFVFSSRHPKTVHRHFHWMAEHGVDGAFLQRPASHCDIEVRGEGFRRIRDEIGDRVREAAEKEGRVFAIMYDVTGVPPDHIYRVLERDWVHLVHGKGVLDSPNYLKEKGKPVIGLWGFGFQNAGHTPQLVTAITNYFRTVTPGGVYILAGTPAHWRTAHQDADRNPEFIDVWLNQFDAICPWTVGRYRTERDVDDFTETAMKDDFEMVKKRNEEGRWRKIDYIPVVFSGASSFNSTGGQMGLNDTKRDGGRFLWKQISNAKRHGARIIYGAMWDAYNDGTAFMPAIEKKRLLPSTHRYPFIALDEDGYDLPSDWYMRICGFAGEGLRSERQMHETFPSKELQDYWASRPKYEEASGAFKQDEIGGSGSGSGGGQTFSDWQAMQKEDKDEVPPPPYSLEAEEAPAALPQQAQATSVSSHNSPAIGVITASSPPRSSIAAEVIPSPMTSLSATHVLSSTGSTYQTARPPPINTGSRPQQRPSSNSGYSASNSPSLHAPSVPSSATASTYPSHIYNNAPPITQDPVASLTSDLRQHRISSPGPGVPPNSPPPLHPAHPAAQGARPSSTAPRPSSRPPSRPPTRPQSQAGYSQTSSPAPAIHVPTQTPAQYLPAQAPTQYPSTQTPTQYPHTQSHQFPPTQTQPPVSQGSSGSWSQAPWPPPEWGASSISTQPQHQTSPPTQQSTYPGQSDGANLTRPHTFTASSYSSPLRPHASSLSARPAAHIPEVAGNRPPITQGSRPLHAPHAPHGSSPAPSPYISGVQPDPPSFPVNPNIGPYSSTSYSGQAANPPYGSSGYTPPLQASAYGHSHTLSSHNQPASEPVPFPGGSYPTNQMPAQGSSYPGQTSFGTPPLSVPSQSPYGTQHGTGHSVSNSVGGFHFPHAPVGDSYFGSAQTQSSGYNPSYISNSTPYGTASSHPASVTPPHAVSGWYPGGPSSSVPPSMPSQPQTQSPYSTSSSAGPYFPTASTGILGTALNAVDKVAGRRARDQLESVTQTGAKLFSKYTK